MIIEKMTWEQFDEACKKIARLVPHSIANIYGIPRGGLVVAVRLSHLLGKPLIDKWDEITKDTLVCDDIADTGDTLRHLKEVCMGHSYGFGITGFKIATLVCHKQSSIEPHIWVYEKGDQWVTFPWEVK